MPMHVPIIPELCLLPRSAYYSKNYASILGTRLPHRLTGSAELAIVINELTDRGGGSTQGMGLGEGEQMCTHISEVYWKVW